MPPREKQPAEGQEQSSPTDEIRVAIDAAIAEIQAAKKSALEGIAEEIAAVLGNLPSDKRTLRVGGWLEFAQSMNGNMEWLPFVVTQVHDEGLVSGVAFSGFPHRIGWNRGAMEYDLVAEGSANRTWRWPEQ